jgi:hypothetical protein
MRFGKYFPNRILFFCGNLVPKLSLGTRLPQKLFDFQFKAAQKL